MEASLDRVGRELGDSYPSLTANLHMTNLEIRAGRTMSEALEHLGDRLGIEEARSFATLIQQSAELGSSITEALRVYSDDMRHKRLSRAEEKAYSLPAKLSVPMMVCIFPVLFVVILLPVFVRLQSGIIERAVADPPLHRGLEVLRRHRGRRPRRRRIRENQPATERAAHCGIRWTVAVALRSLPMTALVAVRRGAAGLRLLGDLHDRQRRRHARNLARLQARSRACAVAAVLTAAGFGLAACAEAALVAACSAGFLDGSRGMILKTASALIAVSTGAATGGVSGALREVAQQQHADGGDERGGHKLSEQPGQKPGGKRMVRNHEHPPCERQSAPLPPTVRGRSGAQCGRFVGGPGRRRPCALTRSAARERIIPLDFQQR